MKVKELQLNLQRFNQNFPLIAVSLIIIFCAIIYSNSFDCAFHFDDEAAIVENTSIRNLWNIREILSFGMRPVLNFTFALNYYFGGLAVFGYHLVNLIIHICCGILAFFIIQLTLNLPMLKERYSPKAKRIAIFAALIYVVHPIHTESITYIVSRSEILCSLFYLTAIFLFILSHYHPKKKTLYYIGAVVSSLLAMGTKAVALTLPAVIMLYDYFFIAERSLKSMKTRKVLHILMFASLLFLLYLVLTRDYGGGVGFNLEKISPRDYLFTQFKVIFYYLRLLIVPVGLNLDYDLALSRSLFAFPTLLSFLILVSILIFTFKISQKNPLFAFLILWFFITLAPTSSIIPLADVIFEHRLYLPSFGFILLCVLMVDKFFEAGGWRALEILFFSAIIIIFSSATYTRNFIWKDNLTLWTDVIKKSPQKARPYYNFALACLERGLYQEAIEKLKISSRLAANFPKIHFMLANAYQEKGLYEAAIEEYRKAIAIDPHDLQSHNNLGHLYEIKGQYDLAIHEYNKAIELNPDVAETYLNKGALLSRQGLDDLAIEEYNKALRINSDFSEAYFNLGNTYRDKNLYQEAVAAYNQALRLDPHLANAHKNIGIVYLYKIEDSRKALPHFEKTLELNPHQPQAEEIEKIISEIKFTLGARHQFVGDGK